MVETLTRTRLRRLAEFTPEHGRVLSVYLNLDPSEFATPSARASAISSLMNDAQHKVEETDGDLPHDDRMALRADLDAVREVLEQPDIADEGARAVAVFACGPAGLLETVRVKRPLESRVAIDATPFIGPLTQALAGGLWCVLLANRRIARIFTGTPEQLDGDGPRRGQRPLAAPAGRLVAAALRALDRGGRARPPRPHRRRRLRPVQARGLRAAADRRARRDRRRPRAQAASRT